MTETQDRYAGLIQKMRFYMAPEISWSEWLYKACLWEGTLTELGTYLQHKLSGGTFVDVPCGLECDAEESVWTVAQVLGIAKYIEVDADKATLESRLQNPSRTKDGISITTIASDILQFLAALEHNHSNRTRGMYISGLQLDQEACADLSFQNKIAVPYLQALYSELARISAAGDVVILNEGALLMSGLDAKKHPNVDPAIGLIQKGFRLRRTCQYNKVHVYEMT